MADSNEISILFIDGKAIAHSPDRSELIEKAYEIVGDIDDGYPYYSLQTRSLDDFGKCIDWHAGIGWLRNATRVSDGSEVWVEILESTWYIHEKLRKPRPFRGGFIFFLFCLFSFVV